MSKRSKQALFLIIFMLLSFGLFQNFRTSLEYPQPDQIVGLWKVDNFSNNLVKHNSKISSIIGPPALVRNNNSKGMNINQGIFSSISFDGIDDYLSIPHSIKLQPGTISLSLKLKTDDKFKNQTVLDNMESGGYAIFMDKRDLIFQVNIAQEYVRVKYPLSKIFNGNWYHVAGTYDGSYLRLFIDGLQVAEKAISGKIFYKYTNSLCIGRPSTFNSCGGSLLSLFKGELSEIIIWNKGLKSKDIAKLNHIFTKKINASTKLFFKTKTSSKLRVMTYNIRKGVGAKAALNIQHSPYEEEQNLNKIVDIISPVNPDVLILQEVDYHFNIRGTRDQVSWLASKLGYKYALMFPVNRNKLFCLDNESKAKICAKDPNYNLSYYPQINSTGNAILSKFPIDSANMIKLERSLEDTGNPNHALETQRVLGQVTLNLGAGKLDVWSTHLEVATGNSRKRQAEFIVDQIKKRNNENLLVFAGDLNADENRDTGNNHGNAAVFEILRTNLVLPPYKMDFGKTTLSGKSDIDHIGYRPSASGILQLDNYRSISDNTEASDHRPVLGDLTIYWP